MKKSVRINTTLLSPAMQARFDAMLQVAGRRSIVQWTVSESPATADVVLKESVQADDDRTVPIYVGDALPAGNDSQRLHLSTDFRVGSLMDALDLAAVRVMNRWDAMARATPLVRVAAAADAPTQQYQLRHWVFLGSNRTGMPYTRTLAAMTQRPVTRQWMTSRGGLSTTEADSLLADLQLRGALHTTVTAPLAQPRDRQAAAQAQTGFIGRLKRWLTGGRSHALTAAG